MHLDDDGNLIVRVSTIDGKGTSKQRIDLAGPRKDIHELTRLRCLSNMSIPKSQDGKSRSDLAAVCDE
jgi:hypothetical protein